MDIDDVGIGLSELWKLFVSTCRDLECNKGWQAIHGHPQWLDCFCLTPWQFFDYDVIDILLFKIVCASFQFVIQRSPLDFSSQFQQTKVSKQHFSAQVATAAPQSNSFTPSPAAKTGAASGVPPKSMAILMGEHFSLNHWNLGVLHFHRKNTLFVWIAAYLINKSGFCCADSRFCRVLSVLVLVLPYISSILGEILMGFFDVQSITCSCCGDWV